MLYVVNAGKQQGFTLNNPLTEEAGKQREYRSSKMICAECKKSGYEFEIVVLETYDGRDKHILNVVDNTEQSIFSIETHGMQTIAG